MNVEFPFAIGDAVVICGSSIEGRVTAVAAFIEDAKQYRVAYWYSGTRVECWVNPNEIRIKALSMPRQLKRQIT